jgi:beta-glucanase (GH16 family)
MPRTTLAHLTTRRFQRRLAVTATVLGLATLLTSPFPADAAKPGGGGSSSGDACGSLIAKSGGTWACTFADNFSGTSLDTSKWYVATTAATGFYTGNTCFTADNVAVRNGELRLTTRDTGSTFACTSASGSFATRYTGAHIGTIGHFSQTYGRFEVRARYPQTAAGVHGGSWLYPDKQTYGAWPASGEIDTSEWWSNTPNTVLPTLHYSGSTTADSGSGCTVADPTTWHTYTLVWQPTVMQFSIDGVTCFTRSWTPDAPLVAPQPFDQPFHLLLTMGVDGTGPNAVGSQTTLPATYEVDYVKAWK